MGDCVSETFVEFLCGDIRCPYLKSNYPRVATAKTAFDPFQQATGQTATAMLWRDSDRGDVAGVVRLEQADNESGHRAVLGNHAVRN